MTMMMMMMIQLEPMLNSEASLPLMLGLWGITVWIKKKLGMYRASLLGTAILFVAGCI